MKEFESIIEQLENQKAAIERALAALRGSEVEAPTPSRRAAAAPAEPAEESGEPRKRRISAAGRRRIAEAARKMWERRRAAAAAIVDEHGDEGRQADLGGFQLEVEDRPTVGPG